MVGVFGMGVSGYVAMSWWMGWPRFVTSLVSASFAIATILSVGVLVAAYQHHAMKGGEYHSPETGGP